VAPDLKKGVDYVDNARRPDAERSQGRVTGHVDR
jgi:hypothetical protein